MTAAKLVSTKRLLIALACTLAGAGCNSGWTTTEKKAVPPAPVRVLALELFAGATSGQGHVDASRADARFSYPGGSAFDGAGNMFLADSRNAVIRKIDSAGNVTTIAGGVSQTGSADGSGAAARFDSPADVALDGAGNVYVADTNNSTIRKITPAGVVSTFAGSAGQVGADDGKGSAARFAGPGALVCDRHGNLYVADTYNNTIRKITPDGSVSTLAGMAGSYGHADGKGPEAQFGNPSSMAIDPDGNLVVADGTHTVRRVTPAGMVTTLAGMPWQNGNQDGAGASATFSGLSGITVDGGGNVFVFDGWSHTLRKITPAGQVSTVTGKAGTVGNVDGSAAQALLKGPARLSSDRAGNVYVSDNNSALRRVAPDGTVSTWAGRTGAAGTVDGTGNAARFSFPNGIAIDAQKNLYVADQDNQTIRKISSAGVVTTLAGSAGAYGHKDGTGAQAQFAGPGGVAVDAAGNLYVTEFNHHVVRKITPAGVVTTLAGAPGESGYADGSGAEVRFSGPNNVAVDKAGNVFVADYYNNAIRKITPAGVVSTFAGAKDAGSADGTGSAARFRYPNSMAFDAAGNMLVTDSANGTVRRITPAGVVTTIAGLAGSLGRADGSGSAARFNMPWGIAVAGSGAIYVADAGNNLVRKIDSTGRVSTVLGAVANYQNRLGAVPGGLAYPIGITIDPATDHLYLTVPDAILRASVE